MDLPPLKTWQFYSACRRILGPATLQKLFKRSQTEIYRWGADPDYASETARNPMDRYETLLEQLMERGRQDVARAAVARQARIVGCELRQCEEVVPDRGDWRDEVLDDHPALARYHEACRDLMAGRCPPERVHHLQDEVIREIRETTTKVLTEGRAE